jgi:hypothetical protein
MAFSDWQLFRLRNALSAYHDYGEGSSGDAFNWKDVTEAISLATDVTIPPERLRQFVDGVNTAEGTRKYPVPKNIDAVAAFATHEEYRLLSEAELHEYAPDRHAALRLREYLHTGLKVRTLPLSMLEGTYKSKRFEAEDYVVRDLKLLRVSEDGIIQLAMIEDAYDNLTGAQFDDLTPKKRLKARQNQNLYSGWAIVTPEDNLMFFLKNADDNSNCYYLCLASDLSHSSRSPVTGFALMYYDFLAEVDDGTPLEPKRMPAIATAVGERIWLFERIT